MVEVNCRDGGRPTHTRGTPEQTGARARAHMVNGTCQDASRMHSSVVRDLKEGLRAKTASHCLAPLKLIFSRFIAPA